MDDVFRRDSLLPYGHRRVHEVGKPTSRLRQKAHGATGHPPKTCKDDRSLRIKPSMAGKRYISNV